MSFTPKVNDLSREELKSFINQLKREINCLTTDLIKCQLIINNYQKYFDYFNETNEKITTNNEILVLINRLKALKYFNENSFKCFVSVEKLSENELNRKLSQVFN